MRAFRWLAASALFALPPLAGLAAPKQASPGPADHG
jgi:hypothetical protein